MQQATELPTSAGSPLRRWALRFWPSTRLGFDPLSDWTVDGRYAPVSIANWKLTPGMRRRLLALRTIQPLSFDAAQRLTVVIPFRDREAHLTELAPVLAATLQAQGIRHQLLVVEQDNPGLFNRGRLINIGVHYSASDSDYYCLHDVDAVPLTANYACPSQPLRLVNKIIGEHGETARSEHYFSGAVSIRKEQMFAANGYSNEYWGWGKEDDDLFFRLLLAGCLCYYDLQGVYRDLPNPGHQQVAATTGAGRPPHVRRNRRRRSELLRGLLDPQRDGLSTLTYRVLDVRDDATCRRIRVRWDDDGA